MREESERLMALLQGERLTAPPYWEPWFAMGDFLQRRYRGSYLDMAVELGHAAVPVGGLAIGAEFFKPVERIQATGVYYGGGVLTDPEQLRSRPEPDFEAQVEPLQARVRAIHDAGKACWMVIGWCFDRIAASMSLENLALDCYDRPDFVHEAMQWVEARNQRGVEQVISRVRPDFVLYNGDCAYKNGPMIDPAMMRDFTFEPSRRTVDMVRDLDIPFAFHSDGKLDDVIPLLLDLGICAVHGCEKQANDLAHLVDRFGDAIALCGNMDVVFLKNATVDEVRLATREMLAIGSAKGRFIAGCNTSPQDYIPDENYLAMLDEAAAYARTAA